jgi:hypothetical protein
VQGRRTDMHYHSPEQVREHMTEALAIVEGLDVPDDLRVAAFGKAFDLLAAKHVVMEQLGAALPNMTLPRGL